MSNGKQTYSAMRDLDSAGFVPEEVPFEVDRGAAAIHQDPGATVVLAQLVVHGECVLGSHGRQPPHSYLAPLCCGTR